MRTTTAAALLVAGLAAPAPAGAAEPGPRDAWIELQRTYASLERYRDAGALEIALPDGGRLAFRFATALGPAGDFRFELEDATGAGAGGRQVLWRSAGEAFLFDSGRGAAGAWGPVSSAVGELARLPGIDPALGLDALMAPALVLTGGESLVEPAGASRDAVTAPCPGAEGPLCRRVSMAWPDAGVEAELWLDAGSGLLRRWRVRETAAAGRLPPPQASPRQPPPRLGAWSVEAEVHRLAVGPDAAGVDAAFQPPPGATAHAQGTGPAPDREPPAAAFGETVEVRLTSVRVRVVAPGGLPLTGLGVEDFRLRVGGDVVPLRGVDEWAADSPGPAADPFAAGGPPPAPPPPGPAADPPLVVLFVQADLEPTRARGHLHLLAILDGLLAALPREVPVAVVSFDSHLKLWSDLTLDREATEEAAGRAVGVGGEPPPFRRRDRRPDPSLAARFDFHAALQAAGNARALELVAEALEPLPGEKVLLYFGFGVGRLSLTGGPGAEYDRALAALKRAGIGVFVLDVTEADFHTLELALKDVVDETGGTYLRARDTSKETLARLATVATSYYQLHVDPRDLPRRPGRVDVDLVGGRGRVLVPRGVSLGRGDATPRVEGPGAGGGSR